MIYYGDAPVQTHFSWVLQAFSPQRGVHSVVNMGGVVKTLRCSNALSRSVFSTAGSLGIALHNVAHRVLRQIPAESEMSRQNRATPPQIKVSHLSLDPSVAGRGGGGLVEGIAALLGSENGSRYRGVSQLQSHQSPYSVQLSPRWPSGIETVKRD